MRHTTTLTTCDKCGVQGTDAAVFTTIGVKLRTSRFPEARIADLCHTCLPPEILYSPTDKTKRS